MRSDYGCRAESRRDGAHAFSRRDFFSNVGDGLFGAALAYLLRVLLAHGHVESVDHKCRIQGLHSLGSHDPIEKVRLRHIHQPLELANLDIAQAPDMRVGEAPSDQVDLAHPAMPRAEQ